jgi:hypothetical protein
MYVCRLSIVEVTEIKLEPLGSGGTAGERLLAEMRSVGKTAVQKSVQQCIRELMAQV